MLTHFRVWALTRQRERHAIPTAEMIYRCQDIAGGNGYDLCQVGFELCFMQTDRDPHIRNIPDSRSPQTTIKLVVSRQHNMSVSEGFRES